MGTKTKHPKQPVQLDLFSAIHFMAVDQLIDPALLTLVEPMLTQAKTMQRFGILHPDTVFAHFNDGNTPTSGQYQQWTMCGVTATVTPKRLRSFKDSMTCVCCGRVGNLFLVEKHENDRQYQYLNLYSAGTGGLVLMTVDHILPDSMGGRYDPDNFQPMCRPCNQAKQHMMSPDEVARVRADPKRYAKSWVDPDYLNALLDLQMLIYNCTDPKHRHRLNSVFDRFRKKVKHGARPPQVQAALVDLRRAIKETDPAEWEKIIKCQRDMNAAHAGARVSTKGSWSARMKRWFASVVQAVGGAQAALRDLRAGKRA